MTLSASTFPLQGRRALGVFVCFAAAYLMSYALRSVNAVVGPELMQELALSNADLGMLSAAYFVGFACMQLPLGVWLDQYGARRTEAALLAVGVLGCMLFASSHSLLGLWLGRALIGVGVSSCLMAAYKAYRLWFPLALQSGLASSMLVAGTSGALCATVPVTAALPFLGWRGLFYLAAAILALLTLILWFTLRPVEQAYANTVSNKEVASTTPTSFLASLAGYGGIFSDPYFRRLGVLGLVNQGIFVALQTLWAGPWMMTVLQLSKQSTSQILFVLNFTLLCGYLALAWIAPRYIKSGREQGWAVESVVSWGLTAAIGVQIIIIFCAASWAWIWWPVLAMFVTVAALVQTHLSLSFPPALAGRSNTAYNLLMFIGAFAAQAGIGYLIDMFVHFSLPAASAMRAAFAVVVVLQALALLYFCLSRARPQNEQAVP